MFMQISAGSIDFHYLIMQYESIKKNILIQSNIQISCSH